MSLCDYKNLKTLSALQNSDNGKPRSLISSPFTGFLWGEEPEEALDFPFLKVIFTFCPQLTR